MYTYYTSSLAPGGAKHNAQPPGLFSKVNDYFLLRRLTSKLATLGVSEKIDQ